MELEKGSGELWGVAGELCGALGSSGELWARARALARQGALGRCWGALGSIGAELWTCGEHRGGAGDLWGALGSPAELEKGLGGAGELTNWGAGELGRGSSGCCCGEHL